MPKRRVTWGGKLQSPLQSPAFHNAGETDLSFAEPFMKKRKADMSVLTEQNEDVEELDFTLDVEMNQSSVRFSESEFLLPNQLESQLENETQQAMEKVETLERRVAELEKELQEKSNVSTDGQEQMKEGFEESVQLCEMLVHEKELLAAERDLLKQEFHVLTKKTDNLEKEKAALLQEMEKNKEMEDFISLEKEVKREHEKLLETEISSLKKASEASERKCQELEANLLALSEELKQKGELAEELQKSSDIDLVQQVKQLRRSLDDAVCLGRDAKKDWAHLRSENISLKERDVTLTAGYEKMEAEVKILCSQLEREKSCFKKMQTDLQRELQGAFEENTKLTALLDGKVPKSLIDSIELEKTVACLKKELEKSHEVERSLHVKIESLSALQDLPEKVESLMKQECDLTEELCAVQTERESLLSAKASSEEEAQQLKENLQSSQEQLVKLLDDLKESEVREHNQTKKCVNITEQLEMLRKDLECSLVANSQLFTTLEESGLKLKDSEDQETIENNLCRIQQVINVLNEKIADSESSRKHNDTQFLEHQEQLRLLNEELESMKAEREHLLSERTDSSQNHAEELEKLLSTVTSLTEERDQLQEILQGVREEKNQLKRDLEENVEMRLNSEPHGEHQETDLCLQIHLESVKDLKEQLEAVKEERSQLKADLQDNVEMMIENQEELRQAQEKIRSLREKNQLLKTQNAEIETRLNNTNASENASSLTDLQERIRLMKEELESVRAERESLLSVNTDCPQTHTEQLEKLLSTVTLLTEERDQLQEILQGVREERNHLKGELEENEAMIIQVQAELKQQQHVQSEQQAERELQEATLQQQIQQLEEKLETMTEERCQMNSDLQKNVEMNAETQGLLFSLQEELQQQKYLYSDLEAQSLEKESFLEQQVKKLSEQLESVQAESQHLLSATTTHHENPAEELENLRSTVTSLTEDKDQLQEILQGIREERNHFKRDLEEHMERIRLMKEELESVRAERESLLSVNTDCPQTHTEQLEKLLSTVTLLTEERDQLQEILQGVREERNHLKGELEENEAMIIQVQAELKQQQHVQSEQQAERELQEASLQQQIQQLEEKLETMTEERCQMNSDLQKNVETAKQLSDELESVQAERDHLCSEKTTSAENHAEEFQKLHSTVTSLMEERDQLQVILEGVREERNHFKRDLEEHMERIIQVQAELKQQQHLQSEQQAERELQEASLQQQIQQLEERLETMTEERCQRNSDLQKNVEMTKQLSDELESVQAERDLLCSEKTNSAENHAEEFQKLLSTVTSLTEERDQLQVILERVREEGKRLKKDLEEYTEMVQHLENQLELVKDECSHLKSNLQENMDKVNNEEQHPNSGTTSTEELCFKMEASTEQIQAFFVRFQLVINGASKPELGPLGDAAQMKEVMIFKLLDLLPKVSRNICSNVNKSTVQITKLAWDIKLHIKHCAKNYKTQFEALLKNDVALFEERRLQDLLLCRARAPSHSVKVAEKELLGIWDQRLLELLNKRGDYLQKMNSVLEKLEESLATQQTAVSDVLMARVESNKELSALCMDQSIDFAAVERFLEQELAHCSAVAQATLLALQGLRDEHQGLLKELGTVRTQADSQLNEERSKTSTLLQMLEDTPVKNEAVFKDNLQIYNLQQLKGEIKEMHMRIEKLEKDKIKAADTVANHKQATQLLQTELQDARAQVIDMEGSIKILEEKLRNAEVLAKRRASPSALELEDLKAKVVKMELEMTALSSKHKEELLRLTSVLNHKEDSLRTLKETLRRSQQEGEQSYMEGEDLHARLISIGGRKVQSNIVIEKNKLAEEVKHLQKKISELESLVSTKQGEITKWKARALKLKRDAVDKPQSPCAPTKRCLPMSSEDFLGSPKKLLGSPKKLLGSPKKLLGSPKKLLGSPQMFLDSPQKFLDSPQKFLDSPKSKFFDVRPGSESMSINCPKQFFDNSTFETAQGITCVPVTLDMETAVGNAEEDADEKGDWCPLSPKQADVCRQQ